MYQWLTMGDITKRDPSEFLGLLVPNQRRVQAFILTLVPNIDDAEDIYQETLSEMWNKFDSFEIGTDFVACAVTIAKFKVLTFIRSSKHSGVHFSESVVESLSSSVHLKLNSLQDHIDALKECLGKLSERDISLLKLRYENDMTFKKIAHRVGKSAPAIHRVMTVIHSKLALCIRRTLRLEEPA
jgi:RNA polymerase sigma-70 factor, ECF subfamily